MQSSVTKEELTQSYDLSTMSSLWDPRMTTDANFGSAPGPSSVMGHSRSISSDSTSSGYTKNALTRDHPSLNNYHGVNPALYMPQYASGHNAGYLSASEKRDPPSAFLPSRRRGASPRSDEDDELPDEPLDPNATEQEKQAYKRRRNTLAARRSRLRRQVQFQKLEEDVARLNRERDIWKERALMMERMLSTHGLPCPNFAER
ncbi:hypothetical protein BDN70DRAFT_199474 [Pholiota conissans]|uniref:BZIP domain-containing protein n=1 Tax=Pholiota conissans TaxID=109636 RepID=A0A9P5YY57_9AGAR|nr:hypothetical protein BDN70DRAFT_199474 [Pholiota conissans]